MNKYIVDRTLRTLTTKALGENEAAEAAMDLHNANSIILDFQILAYLNRWNFFPVTVNLRAMPGKRRDHLAIRTFQLSRDLYNREENFVFNQLKEASPFDTWSRVTVRAKNNAGYHLHNNYLHEEELFPSTMSAEELIREDMREFCYHNVLWMDTMEQYKQDVLDNNWFCLDVPNRTWFITIYQK